jgi:ABC-type multidrug transport system fused ATPase/permease subunit
MLHLAPKVQESPNAVDYVYRGGAIEFDGVSFGHSAKADVDQTEFLFEDFKLKIEPGTTNAIVGRSGFGKTTLLYLLFRIYDPEMGSILIDGQNVKNLKFESFRKYISVIPQNGILFNDTLEFNLRYGNPDATMDEIIEVAKKC